jgi:hypothetical protein
MLTIDYANIRAYTNIINGLTLTYWHWGNPLWLPINDTIISFVARMEARNTGYAINVGLSLFYIL